MFNFCCVCVNDLIEHQFLSIAIIMIGSPYQVIISQPANIREGSLATNECAIPTASSVVHICLSNLKMCLYSSVTLQFCAYRKQGI